MGKSSPCALTEGIAAWEEEDGLVYFKGRLYVPNEHTLCREVLQTCHNNLMAGHPEKNDTLELISRYYWWPCMIAFVASYVEGCDRCQRYQQDHHPAASILPQEVPEGPWQTIDIDMIIGLPESKEKNAILTVVDHYIKQVHLYPMTDGLTALGVANIYFHDVFPLHGILKKDRKSTRLNSSHSLSSRMPSSA